MLPQLVQILLKLQLNDYDLGDTFWLDGSLSTFDQIFFSQFSLTALTFYAQNLIIRPFLMSGKACVQEERSYSNQIIEPQKHKLIMTIKQSFDINKYIMKEVSKVKWKDIITQVEMAGIDQQNRIKQLQKKYNKQYVEIIEEQIKRHKEQKKSRQRQKLRQKELIELQLRKQQQQQSAKKRQKKNIELSYQNSNRQLIKQQQKFQKLPSTVILEHPFIRLVNEQQQRKKQSKDMFKMQNNINKLQSKIKQQERQRIAEKQKQQRQQFIKHIDSYYDKHIQDRKIFKRKYLKLNNLEKSRIVHSNNSFNSNVEDQFLAYNSNQIYQHRQQRQQKDNVDLVIAKMNKDNSIPNNSPAFIGRNPISYDRKKQLEYIQKGLYKRVQDIQVIKTQPTLPENVSFKQTVTAKQLPVLQKFYHKNIKKQHFIPHLIQSPTQRQPIQRTDLISQKPYKIKPTNYSLVKNRVNTQPNEANPHRKFLTYDIILGCSKEVYL